ncbi:hypothetical protein ILUMI_27403, partial [Ignelater luminosus]
MIRTYLFKFAILALGGSFAYATQEEELASSLKQSLENYLTTRRVTPELNYVVEILKLKYLFLTGKKEFVSKLACLACDAAVDVAIAARRAGMIKEILADFAIGLCVLLEIDSVDVCHGTVELHIDTLLYIVDHKKELTSKRVCSIALQKYGCKDPNRKDWTIYVPSHKETLSNIKQKRSESKPFTVLQLTDIHYDPGYEIGSNAACNSHLCCQKGTKPLNLGDAAGYWGDYRFCDLPWHLFTNALDHITTQKADIDFVYFTGDIINHKVWQTSIPGNIEAITRTFHQLRTAFGSIPVYPILGNHEAHPVNLYSPEGVVDAPITSQWIYSVAAREWETWLPIEARETILKGGFYTALIRPRLRVIALNSNVCYTFNWWLFYDDLDPYGQLQWLVEVLSDAEKADEVVHILSHIPNGDEECLYNWSREYLRIITRFSHIIAAQFTGHTHYDETVIFFNKTNPVQAINVAFNGGSLTTWDNLNPNYKIYKVDSGSAEVLDYESWSFNVTEANLVPNILPRWQKLYSFKDAYGVNDLSPQELARLTIRMATTPYLPKLYFRYKWRESDTALAKGCNDECEIHNLCNMVTYQPEYTIQCKILTDIYNYLRNL